jgi:hypothetical protein
LNVGRLQQRHRKEHGLLQITCNTSLAQGVDVQFVIPQLQGKIREPGNPSIPVAQCVSRRIEHLVLWAESPEMKALYDNGSTSGPKFVGRDPADSTTRRDPLAMEQVMVQIHVHVPAVQQIRMASHRRPTHFDQGPSDKTNLPGRAQQVHIVHGATASVWIEPEQCRTRQQNDVQALFSKFVQSSCQFLQRHNRHRCSLGMLATPRTRYFLSSYPGRQ